MTSLASYMYIKVCRTAFKSKHLDANFKHLLGMKLATDVIFLVLASVNNDLFMYFCDHFFDKEKTYFEEVNNQECCDYIKI